MRVQRFIQYGVLAGFVLAGVACAGNSPRTEDTAVAQDTTTAQDTSAYRGMIRDTGAAGLSDSAKWRRANPSSSEVKPGESTTSDTTKQ